MKKMVLFAVAIMLLASVSVSGEDKVVPTKIDKVTVFRSSGQIYRSGWVEIPAGNTDLLIEGVSPYVNVSSIQTGGKGDFTILSASFNMKYETPSSQPVKEIPASILNTLKRIQDSLKMMNFRVMDINNRKGVFNQEKSLLLNDKTFKNGSDTIPELRQMLDFYRERMNNINAELLRIAREESESTEIIDDLQRRKQQYEQLKSQYQVQPTSISKAVYQIVVKVSADKASRVMIDVNYLVNNAGWRPVYELKADDTPGKMKLIYKAGVFQNTMVDWKGVPLTLSNMDPNRNSVKPILSPWRLDYYYALKSGYNASNMIMTTSKGISLDEDVDKVGSDVVFYDSTFMPGRTGANYMTTNISYSNVEFTIPLAYELLSGQGEQVITVGKFEVDAIFEHSSVPKMEKESYLMAKLTGWESLNLLPGEARVYMGTSLIGAFNLNPYVLEDTLIVSLGRDPGVVVQRLKTKDDTEHKVLSKQYVRTMTIEVSVRNAKSTPVVLTLEDQIPISKNEKIEVKAIDLGGAVLDSETGALSWRLNLNPNETRKVTFTYSITYDKGKSLFVKD